jgi:hypothetical protein
MRTAAAILALVCTAHAGFVQPLGAGRVARRAVRVSSQPSIVATMSEEPLEELTVEPEMPMPFNPAYVALGFAAFVALQPEMAMAKGGEYGLAEGRIISLAHPTVMALMCGPPTRVSARARPRAYQHAHARISTPTRVSAHPRAYQRAHAHATHVCCAHRAPRHALPRYTASAFAAFTGLQWRRLREVGGTITDLKKELKPLQAQVEAAGESGAPAAVTAQVAELTAKVDELSATRKALAKDDLRDKHYQVGSLILGLGTSFAIEGPVNTFMRAGKLFPGPHLYAGAGVVVAWAMAASMVPNMAKGKDWARTAHISFNVLALGFFTWQARAPLRPARRFARRHATQHNATQRHATPRHATPRHATPRHATPRPKPVGRKHNPPPASSARVLPPAADPHRPGDRGQGHREDQIPLR